MSLESLDHGQLNEANKHMADFSLLIEVTAYSTSAEINASVISLETKESNIMIFLYYSNKVAKVIQYPRIIM